MTSVHQLAARVMALEQKMREGRLHAEQAKLRAELEAEKAALAEQETVLARGGTQ